MTPRLLREDVERLRLVVNQRLGLYLDESRNDWMPEVLAERLAATGAPSASSYLQGLGRPNHAREEVRALAERLTVGETYFFRNREHFRALTGTILPHRIEARRSERVLRVLSAGCSSGEEPYSLAIVLLESFPALSSWDVSILGIDINPAALRRAERGRYTAWSLRQTPDAIRSRYFRPEGREFVLSDRARATVAFEEHNLADDGPMWTGGPYDLVLCRNVTMYFDPDTTREVIGRLANVMEPHGFLLLGHAETLRGLSTDFHLCHTDDTFYYQRRAAGEAAENGGQPHAQTPAALVDAGTAYALAESRVEIIRQASDRVALLTRGHEGQGPTHRDGSSLPVPPESPSTAMRASLALDLLRAERFTEALELLEGVPAGTPVDPDMLLLRAVLLTNSGAQAEAERLCLDILARDELNAGAHYLIALCREQRGDRQGALDHDQIATYLDPAFAMPRLHIGLLARRAGDLDGARRSLEEAIQLLSREDASRVLLFGGGFSRDALGHLCRAELLACGGAR